MSAPFSMAYAAKPTAATPADSNAPRTLYHSSVCHLVLLETKFLALNNESFSVKQEVSSSTDYSPELAGIIPTGG